MKLTTKPVKLLLIITFSVFCLFLQKEVFGASSDDRVDELQEQIKEIETQISKLQGEEKSLKNEIAYLSAQVYYTELKIQQTSAQIAQKEEELVTLESDIENLGERLEKLNVAISLQQRVIKAHIREKYKKEESMGSSPLVFLMQAENFSDMVGKIKYLKQISEQDRLILSQMNLTRSSFVGQQNLLTNKKDKVGILKQEIEKQKQANANYKGQLEDQKKTKEWVLEETKNQEQNYQDLLAQIRAELASIDAAFASIIGAEGKEVKAGDIIAYEGNSGCSTGPHLHFGVYKNGKAVNPRNYLGDELEWPIDNKIITQEYGENYSWYMSNFGVPGHNGIDLTGPSPFYGTPIRAAADGMAYVATDSKACYMTGTVGKGVIIDHGDGLKTIYWHVK